MLIEKNPDGRMKKDPRRARLTLIEERVLRMRYGARPSPVQALPRKTDDPELLEKLYAMERRLVARLSTKHRA
jgi:hypothetical protein